MWSFVSSIFDSNEPDRSPSTTRHDQHHQSRSVLRILDNHDNSLVKDPLNVVPLTALEDLEGYVNPHLTQEQEIVS
jgi:hypothetical protein